MCTRLLIGDVLRQREKIFCNLDEGQVLHHFPSKVSVIFTGCRIAFLFRCVIFWDSGGEKFLKETIVLKLNGGLGTSMGLDKAKSLLPVKGEDTFLDLTAKQVCGMYLKGTLVMLVIAVRLGRLFRY